ncbi:hypothetical protein N2152v2_002978 [Parachlorella kessleri]
MQKDTGLSKNYSPDLQGQAAAYDFYSGADATGETAAGAKVRGAVNEAADRAKHAEHDAVGAMREGGQRVEDAAGTARAKAEGLGEAAKEKATELKDAAARKADDISASLRKEQESGMTATERASGRARAEADDLTVKAHDVSVAVSDKMQEAQYGAVHAMRETGANIAESLDSVAAKASEAVEVAKEKLGFAGK